LRQRADDLIELFLLPAEILRALRIAPDIGVFELARDDFEAFTLCFEVKDTSGAAPSGPSNRITYSRSGSTALLP
jgi:hypothetical protein